MKNRININVSTINAYKDKRTIVKRYNSLINTSSVVRISLVLDSCIGFFCHDRKKKNPK